MTQNAGCRFFKKVLTLFIIAFFMISGFLVGFILSQILNNEGYTLSSILILSAFICVGIYSALAFHNLGHFLAGKIFGYKLLSYNFIEIVMVPFKKPVGYGIQCLYFLSGILMNLFMVIPTIAFLVFYPSLTFLPQPMNSLLHLQILILLICFLYAALINLTSFVSNDRLSDGKFIWGILFHNTNIKYNLDKFNIDQAILFGVRPRQIPIDNSPYDSNYVFDYSDMPNILNLYYRALDSNNIRTVLKFYNIMESNISVIPQDFIPIVKGEICFINCIKGDVKNATYYFNSVKADIENNYSMTALRILAYYEYYINENLTYSRFYAKAAFHFQASFKQKGLIPVETRLLNDILDK